MSSLIEPTPGSESASPDSPPKTRAIKAQPNTVVWALPKGEFGNWKELRLLLMGYARQRENRGSSVEVLLEPNDPTPTVKGPIDKLRRKIKELRPEILDVLDGDVDGKMSRVRTFVRIHLRAPKEVK